MPLRRRRRTQASILRPTKTRAWPDQYARRAMERQACAMAGLAERIQPVRMNSDLPRLRDEASLLGKRVRTIARDRRDRNALCEEILQGVVIDRDRFPGRLARALEARIARIGRFAAAEARAELCRLIARRGGFARLPSGR